VKVGKLSLLVLGAHLLAQTSYAGLDVSAPRGEATTHFKSPQGVTEVCIIPKKLSPSDFSDKDLKDEKELCSMDFYGIKSDAETPVPMITCPKQQSTNPATLVGVLPAGMTKAQAEAKLCKGPHNDFDMEAKFKTSITCSYVPANLAYWQLSKMFQAGRVMPAVLRTFDATEHEKIMNLGLQYSEGHAIEASWKRIEKAENAEPDLLYDTTRKTAYGALVKNLKKEAKYTVISGVGVYDTRYERFLKQAPFLRVADGRSVPVLAQSDELKTIVSTAVQMKDVSDMILLDVLLSQEDRIGNMHVRYAWYWPENGRMVSKVSKAKYNPDTKQPEIPKKELDMAKKSFLVREMYLKDNDCGVNVDKRTNMMRRYGVLEQVRHMSPETYKRFMQFAKIARNPETIKWLQTELLFRPIDVRGTKISFLANVDFAAKTLLENCRSGLLKLDLNVDDYAPGAKPTVQSCDI
jgi:hypothetical protein